MEWNRENLLFLSQLFPQTLSPVSEVRRAAEKSLSEATDLPNYGLAVLGIVAELTLDEQIRHAAAVNFKNHLRSRWLPSADSGISPIINGEKEQIKTLIVSHMLIMGTIEVKLTVVAATKYIYETAAFLDPSAAKLWGKMLDSIVTLVSRPEQKRVLYEPEMPDVGYTAAFVKLHSIGKEEDPLSDITDPKELLASSVARLFSADPAKYTQIIGKNLEQANQEALLQLCNAYNCKLV